MSLGRVMVAVLLALALSGCMLPEEERLRTENQALKAEKATLLSNVSRLENALREQAAAQRERDAYMESQAAIAAACDFLVPLCPDSVTQVGRHATEQGYSGASNLVLWLALIGKLLATTLLGLGAYVALSWGFATCWRPARAKVDAARTIIAEAAARTATDQQREQDAERNVQIATDALRALEAAKLNAQRELDEVQRMCAERWAECDAAEGQLRSMQAARDAMNV